MSLSLLKPMSNLLSKEPVFLGSRLADSPQFKTIFAEGMALVEEVSLYLDTKGRLDSKDLSRTNAISFAAESMRLTTRLMQLASWLMVQRALNEGEITSEQALGEKNKSRLSGMGPSTPSLILQALPVDLQSFILRTQNFYERINNLNKHMNAPKHLNSEKNKTLVDQFARLQKNFG